MNVIRCHKWKTLVETSACNDFPSHCSRLFPAIHLAFVVPLGLGTAVFVTLFCRYCTALYCTVLYHVLFFRVLYLVTEDRRQERRLRSKL